MCIFTVKSVIDTKILRLKTILSKAMLFIHVLDARKPFDRVNHWTLPVFAKLIDSQAPLLIVRVTILVSNAKRLSKMGKLLFTFLYYLQ